MQPSAVYDPTAQQATPQINHEYDTPGMVNGQPTQTGNWMTHLLPTIGSVAVPALGALLAPETGGLSLIAAAGLSGLGAAGGKAAENAVEGKSVLDKSVLNEGLLGAAGGAVGGIAGKALGKAAGGLANRAENIASATAAKNAATDAIETTANTYKDIAPALQKAYNAKDSLAHVTNMGFDVADPNNLVHVSNASNDILNGVLDKSLANSGPVNLSNYSQIVKDALAKEGGSLGSYNPVAVSRGRMGPPNNAASKLLAQLENLGAGVAKPTSDPNEIRTLTTKLGQLAQDAKPTVTAATGAIDPTQRAAYNAINDVRNQVKTALYDRPVVNSAIGKEIGNVTAEDVGSQQLADHLNNIITQAGQGNNPGAQSLLSEISRNINIGNLGQEGQKIGQIVTSTGGKARAAMEAGLSDAGPDTNPLLAAAGTVTPGTSMAGNVVNFAKHAATNPAILDTLSRIGKLGAKIAPSVGAAAGTLPGMGADPVSVNGVTGTAGLTGTTNDPTGGTMQNNGNSYQDFINAMESQAVLAPNLGTGASSFLSTIAPQLQKNQLVSGELNALPAAYANAGGAQGTGGILSRLSALVPGTAANTYQQQQAAAAQALASALGITPQAAMGLLPQLMQNQGTAAQNTGILSSLSGQLAH